MPARVKKRARIEQKECVACGSCVPVCPRGAIHIKKGLYAQVEETLCVGCAKCRIVCPASVITIMEVCE